MTTTQTTQSMTIDPASMHELATTLRSIAGRVDGLCVIVGSLGKEIMAGSALSKAIASTTPKWVAELEREAADIYQLAHVPEAIADTVESHDEALAAQFESHHTGPERVGASR